MAFLYEPKSSEYTSDDELPPVLVRVHGGPTGQSDMDYSRHTQFWTTRGFAVLDVDYTGSSGYGCGSAKPYTHDGGLPTSATALTLRSS